MEGARDEDADFALLQRWAQGDRAAADALTRRHYVSVRRFFDVKAPHVSEDLTQRVFLGCVEGIERYRGASTFKAYLFGIARRQLLTHLAKSDRLASMEEFDEPPAGSSILSATGILAKRDEQRLILCAMDLLAPEDQMLLQMHYWEDMRSREIGEALELGLSTVTSRLSRARQKLRDNVRRLSSDDRVGGSVLRETDMWARSVADRS